MVKAINAFHRKKEKQVETQTQQELETLINLFNLVSDILDAILAQRAIVNKTLIVTENVD